MSVSSLTAEDRLFGRLKHNRTVVEAKFSPNGSHIATITQNHPVRSFNSRSGLQSSDSQRLFTYLKAAKSIIQYVHRIPSCRTGISTVTNQISSTMTAGQRVKVSIPLSIEKIPRMFDHSSQWAEGGPAENSNETKPESSGGKKKSRGELAAKDHSAVRRWSSQSPGRNETQVLRYTEQRGGEAHKNSCSKDLGHHRRTMSRFPYPSCSSYVHRFIVSVQIMAMKRTTIKISASICRCDSGYPLRVCIRTSALASVTILLLHHRAPSHAMWSEKYARHSLLHTFSTNSGIQIRACRSHL